MVTQDEKYDFDPLLAERIGYETPISEGNPVGLMKMNPLFNEAAQRLLANSVVNIGSGAYAENNSDEISGGKISLQENIKSGEIAKTPKQLQELLELKINELQARLPNLNKAQLMEFIVAHAGTVNVEEGKAKEASDEKAKKDAELAREVAGMLFGVAGSIAGVYMIHHQLSNEEEKGNVASSMLQNPALAALAAMFNKDKSKDFSNIG